METCADIEPCKEESNDSGCVIKDDVSVEMESKDQDSNEGSTMEQKFSWKMEDIKDSKDNSGDGFSECQENIVTKEMIAEEEKIRDQLDKEESNLKKKITEADKEKTFQRLLSLLNRSQLYANYLKEKMKEQQEKAVRKQQQAQMAQKKKAEKEDQKENLNQDLLRTTRGSEQNNNNTKEVVNGSTGKKRGRPKSPKGTTSQKRKKTENTNTNESLKGKEGSSQHPFDLSDLVFEDFSDQMSHRQPQLLMGGIMRDYQLDGFEWLKVLYENGINGILADEMGLGKTIQVIALMSHLVGKNMTGPYLIIAPLSTLPNWYSEFKRFAPQIPVILYHGEKKSRDILRKKISRELGEGTVKSKPVVLTSYEITVKDAAALRRYYWRYVIVDEGHRLKNFNSRLFVELKSYQTANRLLLTGTPLQNNLSELWSLLNFLLPEIFDNLSVFESWFDVETMSSGGSDEEIIAQEQEKHIISTLHEILTPFLLRRTKADVDLNLPPKKELMVYAPLTEMQELFYKAILDKSIYNLLKERSGGEEESGSYFDANILESRIRTSVKHTDYSLYFKDWTEKQLDILDRCKPEELVPMSRQATPKVQKVVSTLKNEVKLNTRNLLMPLRKVCNHPYLLEYPLDAETEGYKVDEGLVKVCGKLQILDLMLPVLQNRGHKVLLFSQMTSLLDIIEDYCSLRKYSYRRLDGSVKLEDRQILIRDFNKDPSVFLFLLSTRAGGLGINLTAADTVIIYDSDWNPQCDLQAQDRCHRFGQTKPVVIYRLVTANTVDERIVTRASAKRRLEKMIMKKGRFTKSVGDTSLSSSNGFSEEELKELLRSTDHSGIVRTDSKQLLSPEQLDMLLDRRDLCSNSDQTVHVSQIHEGVFKVLDSDVNNSQLDNVDHQ